MPVGARPTSTLPPEPEQPPVNIEVFERAFAAADAATQRGNAYPAVGAPRRGLRRVIAGLGDALIAALGGWLEPRCPNCAARGTVALELRAVADGQAARLWERCYACDSNWVSMRCEDWSPWS